jgi:uncharacterized protein YdaU (DUF1376 family)
MARPWFAFYAADYIADTLALSAEQHGAYLLLLMAYWQKQGALPDDNDQLAAICRLPAKTFHKHRALLAAFFKVEDGVWRSKRMEAEIAKTNEIIATKTAAGKKSAALRQQTVNTRSTDVGTDAPTHAPTEGATERQHSGQQNGNQPQPQSPLRVSTRIVRGGAKVFAGIGERERKPKHPDNADTDMVRHLSTRCGMTEVVAKQTVWAARDPDHPDHTSAARLCERQSREHRIGWFHAEAAE